ncbi:MAG TPA: hypothetical protein VJP04_08565 [Terriglobales bacterium]|nr:hypothetical protein [Terriglobales bacterium]
MIRLPRVSTFAVACLALFALAGTAVAQQIPTSMYQQMRWRMIGPFRGGRTRAATGVPGQPNVFYIGVGDGGVWKSDDYGRTWNPIFDGQPTQSIGAIAVAASDPNIIYLGSGEGLHRPDLSVGDGVYKSTDGGKNWTNVGLPDSQQIPALAVDPHDPNRVFAAVLGHPYGPSSERGIYRSTDGGRSWQRVLYKDENTGGCDIEMDPANPNVLYACMWEAREGPWEDNNEFNGTAGGLFKSSDGGTTWQQLTNGLPKNLVQVNVAIAPSQPSRLYATVATTEPGDYESAAGLGFYRSDDAGQTWHEITKDARPAMRIGGGDLPIPRVDPKNADVVYSASIVTVRSTDGGKTWTSLRGAPGGDDYQNLWISPDNSNVILLVSDQGAIVTVNGGRTWSSWYNQPTAQLYHAAVSNDFPYKVCSGQQESGSVCILSRGNDGEITFRDWRPVGIIEYGYAAPDPLNPDIVYGAGRTEVSRFHWSTGQVENVTPIPLRNGKYRADRTQPVMFSPLDPHTMYYAANLLFKTTDGGHSWQTISPDLSRQSPGTPGSVGKLVNPKAGEQRGVIYSLAPSFKNVNTIWAGTDDGQIWITRNGGKNWSNVTPPELTPWSKVTQLEASHFDDQTAYASVSRFRINDLKPYIYRTQDGGKSWQLITTGLPDNTPADTVREDPVRKGLLFAGTETGVYISFDDGSRWQSLQLNLPHIYMRDLWIHDADLIVATHGRSFWILDDITPLRQLTPEVAGSGVHLFQPAPAYRVRRSTYPDTPLPPDEPAGQNPPNGAIIDYFLAQPASGAVTLEILDAQGKVVRRYASNDKPELTEEELKKQLIPLYWIRMPQVLSAAAGAHRWVWKLHYDTPLATHYSYPISAVPHDTPRVPQGPRALPGQYTVRLTVDGQSYTAPLTVKMDPRVKTPPAGLEQQFQMETRLASMMTQAAEAVLQARSAGEQLHTLTTRASGQAKNAITVFENKLNGVLGKSGESSAAATELTLTRVNGDVVSLYGDVDRGDAAPTEAQTNAMAETEGNFASVMQRWNALKNTDLPALNRQLRGSGLPTLQLRTTAADEGGEEE